MFESPTSVDQIINSRRLGTTRELARQAFDAYSPGVQKIYSNYSDPRTEPVLLEWGLFHYNFTCASFLGLAAWLLRLHAIGRLRSCKRPKQTCSRLIEGGRLNEGVRAG